VFEVTMPKLSDSMEEGRIIEWRKKEGDAVQEGDIIAEVESDKAAMELECFASGVLKKIIRKADDVVGVGEVIALIDETAKKETRKPTGKEEKPGIKAPAEEKEKAPPRETKKAERPRRMEAPPEEAGEVAARAVRKPHGVVPTPPENPKEKVEIELAGEAVKASPYARTLAAEKGMSLSGIKGSGPGGRILARDIEAAEGEAPEKAPSGRFAGKAEPLALELARKFDIDLREVTGSGRAGRITTADVLAYEKRAEDERHRHPDAEIPEVKFPPEEADVEEASFMRKTIARMVVASKHVIPHFYITKTVDATRLLEEKEKRKKEMKITVTHFIIKAAIESLKKMPDANRSWDRGKIIKWKKINIGLAIQTDEGLTVAVLRDAGRMAMREIIEKTSQLVERARKSKLSQEERQNATFSVSNLGMFDVESFSAIINPPSSCTLAVASSIPSPYAVDGKVEVRQVMKLTMSCDHRIIDGMTAAQFLGKIKGLLERPGELV